MRVRDWMSHNTVTVAPETPLLGAMRLRAHHLCRYLPVVESGRIVGMVGERQLRELQPLSVGPRSLLPVDVATAADRPVSSVMTGPATVACADESVSTAARRMVRAGLEALPVVEHGRFVGTLSLSDCVRALLTGQPATALVPAVPGPLAALERTLEPA